MSLTIFYCGADMPWRELEKRGFQRRNACLLQAFTRSARVERVIVVNYVLRSRLIRAAIGELRRRRRELNDAVDIFVTSLLPERWSWFPLRILNWWLMRLQIWIQVGSTRRQSVVTWCYWPEGYRVARRLQLSWPLVFDADHDLLHDENQSAGDPAELETLLDECARQADLVVAGARSVLDWFREHGARKVMRLRNGVDLSRFPAVTVEQKPRARPVIGYVGTLSPWIDHELLRNIAGKRPDWTFRVVGRPYKGPSLAALPNLEFVGERSASQLPNELQQFDVALGLYHKKEWLDVDSMKFFEYLAAGIPVVSVPFHPHLREDFAELLELTPDTGSFITAIERILNWDEQTWRDWHRRREEFIARQTWAARAEEAIDQIERLAGGN